MRELPAFPFIVGCGRSGTTLLRLMIDAHPEVTIPPEAYFALSVGRVPGRTRAGIDAGAWRRQLQRQRWFRRWDLDDEAVGAALPDGLVLTYADALRALFSAYARKEGKPRYGNKTPRHVLSMPAIAEHLPEARFVHIIRDGRDVALSLRDVDFGPDDVPAAAALWVHHVERGRADGARLGPDRYREIRYEELIEDPEASLRSLAPFLDVAYDRAMLAYPEHAPSRTPGAALRQRVDRHVGEAPTKGLRDWRTQMVPADVARFEAVAGRTLRSLGYPLSGVPTSSGERALARTAAWRSRVGTATSELRLTRALRGLGRG